jgi:hypothetical protein
MDEKALEQLQHAFALYKDLSGSEASRKLEALLKDFLENGLGMRSERLEALMEQFQRLDIKYKDFLWAAISEVKHGNLLDRVSG